MKKTIFLTLCLFSILGISHAQYFTNINAGLFGVGFANAAWGDYDKDGDLDFVIVGEPPSTMPVTKIYRNDNGTFTDIHAAITGYTYSTVEWGDYDNDSDLDLLVTGNDSLSNSAIKIFGNFNGTFVDVGALLPDVVQGNATWGDFDNDNDLDILMAGNLRSKVLRNDGSNQFTDIGADFPHVQNAFCSWTDFNNDGWQDALIGGDLGGTYVTKLFVNNHGTFEEAAAEFKGLSGGFARWGDLDNDGDQDLLLAGMDPGLLGNFYIYKNSGNGQFELNDNYTFNLLNPFIDLGDYDNDGLPDIILTGRIQGCGGVAVTMLYHNDGDFVLSDINSGIEGFRQGASVWGDYNNDGYADLLINGFSQTSDPLTSIYHNELGTGAFVVNTMPETPSGLVSQTSGNSVVLHWNRASDAETPVQGLSYNIWIGTSQDNADVLNPLSNLQTGFRKVVRVGNAGKDTTFNISDLEAGTYYWSVQAIDNGFLGSAFAESQMFMLDPVGMDEAENDFSVLPNPATDFIQVNCPGDRFASLQIIDVRGLVLCSFDKIPRKINVSHLKKGIYLVRICSGEKNIVKKFVIE